MSWRYPNKERTEAVRRAIPRQPVTWGRIHDTVEKNEGPITSSQLIRALRILEYRGEIIACGNGRWRLA